MFDVLEERWIPVLDRDHKKQNVSLETLICNAQTFSELAEPDSILECALYRFLFTFVSDMVFQSYGDDDEIEDIIEELYQKDGFSQEMFTSYVEFCRSEGTSFDLFDEVHPFMQNGAYSYTKDDVTSIAKINPRVASGTNKLFQCHTAELEAEVSLAEATKLLLAESPFNTPGGSGWGSNHFGAYPPLFSYVMGNNLYETLVFNIIENKGAERPDHLPYWRMSMNGAQRNEEAHVFSTHAAMQYPWRFTKLIPGEGNCVRQMYHTPGYKIEKTRPDILPDPFATYLKGKKGESFLFCPKDADLAWKNISGIFDLASAPEVVVRYKDLKEILGLAHIDVASYVTVVKDVHGTYTGAWKNRVVLSTEVLDPAGKMLECMQTAIEYADSKLRVLTKSAEKVFGKEDFKSIKPAMEGRYNAACRSLFFDRFLPSLSDPSQEIFEKWTASVQRLVLEMYELFVIDAISGMEKIRTAYEQRKYLFDSKFSMEKRT